MRAVIGSVAVHAVIVWLVVGGEREGAPQAPPAPSVAIVEVITPVEVELAGSTGGGGGASPPAVRVRSRRRGDNPIGSITMDHGTGGEGAGTGSGTGTGSGAGIGFGEGGSIARVEQLAPPPPPRGDPPSKARPARLIYPTRERDVEDAELFIARVIIDDDGYVAGAKLVRGFGGRRDEVAAQMIWRFRYAPALDAAGQPVRSTLDQRFLVGP